MAVSGEISIGDWEQIGGAVREKWTRLSDRDIADCSGSYEKLLDHIQRRYGRTREEAKRELDAWLGR